MTFVVDDTPRKISTPSITTIASGDLVNASAGRPQIWEDLGMDQGLQTGFYRSHGKRLLDLVLGGVMLVALAPLLLALLLVVAADGGRPIFAHRRVGQNGRLFRCLKIRSMRPDAEQQLAAILAQDPVAAAEWAAHHKLTNDPRVTLIGDFLRKSSLDELPQIINVLRGDMSLVGPRPITPAELDRYDVAARSYTAIKPGLTGPWQVNGRNDISYDTRVALDARYARSYSFTGDFGIIFRTALSVLKMTGK